MVIKEIDANAPHDTLAWWLLTGAGATKLGDGPTNDIAYGMAAAGVPVVALTYLSLRALAQDVALTRESPDGVHDG